MNRKEKEEVIANLKDKFSAAKSIVFTNYQGLTVAELSDLRKRIKESGIEYRVVKNTLAKIASEATTHAEAVKNIFSGPLGIAIGYDEPLGVIREILKFSKQNEKLQVLSGLVEGQLVSSDRLKDFSQLPSRKVLLSMFAGAMAFPLNKLALALNATIIRFAHALHALKDKKGKE